MELTYPDPAGCLLLNRITYKKAGQTILDSVSVSIELPSTHLIVGEHGSGKTSLAEVLTGYTLPTEGSIVFRGIPYKRIDRRLMKKLGISAVFAETSLVDSLRIIDNFFLPVDSDSLFPRVYKSRNRIQKMKDYFKMFGLSINPSQKVYDLNKLERLKIELISACFHAKSVLVLDNVFEQIPISQYKEFFQIINKARAQGLSVVIFSEKIDELFDVVDNISILRKGKILITEKVKNLSRLHILRLTYSQLTHYNPIVSAKNNFTHLLKYNEAILNSLPFNLIITGPEKNIEIINRSAISYFRTENQESLGKPIDNLFGVENADISDLLSEALEEKEPQSFVDVPLILRSKKTLNVIKTFPINDGPVSIGCMIIIEDITAQTLMRNQLNLSERLASVGLLAAGVAHEINTPLSTLRNVIDTIRMDPEDKKINSKLEDMDSQISYIANIIENLMLFSSSKPGNREKFDLNTVIIEISKFLRKSLEQKQIKMNFDLFPEQLYLRGYMAEFKQVVMNLLKNSMEAIGADGEICISSARIQNNGDEFFEIAVGDTGKGICNDIGEKIFYPFFSTKKGEKNYGLGLFVSHQIVESMKGQILFETPSGGGCLVKIQIPCDFPTD